MVNFFAMIIAVYAVLAAFALPAAVAVMVYRYLTEHHPQPRGTHEKEGRR